MHAAVIVFVFTHRHTPDTDTITAGRTSGCGCSERRKFKKPFSGLTKRSKMCNSHCFCSNDESQSIADRRIIHFPLTPFPEKKMKTIKIELLGTSNNTYVEIKQTPSQSNLPHLPKYLTNYVNTLLKIVLKQLFT